MTEEQLKLRELLKDHYFYSTELKKAATIYEQQSYDQAIKYLVHEARESGRSVGAGNHPLFNFNTGKRHVYMWAYGQRVYGEHADPPKLILTHEALAKLAFPKPQPVGEPAQMSLW